MNQRRAAGILLQVCDGILTAVLHPALVELGLEQVGGDVGVEVVEAVLTILELRKLEIVVVVEQRHACILYLLADGADLVDHLHEELTAGTALLGNVGNDDILASDCLVVGDNLVDVGEHVGQRHVSRYGYQTDLVTHGLHLLGGVVVEACELDAVITHILDLLERALEVLGHIVTDAVELQSDGEFVVGRSVALGALCCAVATARCHRETCGGSHYDRVDSFHGFFI